jgi:hypothetical protein
LCWQTSDYSAGSRLSTRRSFTLSALHLRPGWFRMMPCITVSWVRSSGEIFPEPFSCSRNRIYAVLTGIFWKIEVDGNRVRFAALIPVLQRKGRHRCRPSWLRGEDLNLRPRVMSARSPKLASIGKHRNHSQPSSMTENSSPSQHHGSSSTSTIYDRHVHVRSTGRTRIKPEGCPSRCARRSPSRGPLLPARVARK